jgi:Cu/Ag efflux pump CusA
MTHWLLDSSLKFSRAVLAVAILVILGERPGQEIEHPLALVILGGLLTSTLLNLLVVPSLYLRFGRKRSASVAIAES